LGTFPRSVPLLSCLGALQTIPLTSWLVFFCSGIHCQQVDLSNQFNLPQVDSNQVVETSQG
jgi:hypothetical protein